jgi:hypothetical protein
MEVYQKTRSYNWKKIREVIVGSSDVALNLSTVASGGSYKRRDTMGGVISINRLFPNGDVPNYLAICPVAGGGGKDAAFRFRVDIYHGPDSDLERICLISAVTGAYRTSSLPTGTPVACAIDTTSAWYCDTLNHVTSYNNGVELVDAGGNNGRGYLFFDLMGATHVGVRSVSTLFTSAHVHFLAKGMF